MSENQRTVTLPTIPRQVAEVIERLRNVSEYDNADFIDHVVACDPESVGVTLRSIPFDTLLAALVNGYTVEKSAEELEREAHDLIRNEYRGYKRSSCAEDNAYAEGMCDTLNHLGIKIEGVNA